MEENFVDPVYPFSDPVYNMYGTIDCNIMHPDYGSLPCTISEEAYPTMWAEAIAMGVAPYIPNVPKLTQLAYDERDYLIDRFVNKYAGSVLAWNDLTPPKRAQITQYRTALLNIDNQPGFPITIDWPEPPNV